MLNKKGHRAALMHLAKQMRDAEFGEHESPEEESMESPEDEAMEHGSSPLSKMAKDAETEGLGGHEEEDPEMTRRKSFMKGIRPMQKRVSVTVVAPMGKGKMKRG